MPGDWGSWDITDFTSLVEFHDETTDIIWLRHSDTGGWLYQGGTGYATNGTFARWSEAAKHGVYALGFGIGGVVALTAPEPTLTTKALAVVSFIKCGDEVWKGNRAFANFARSINADQRLRALQGQ